MIPAAIVLLQPSPTLVIAHRGASAYLPEHTLPAYAMAHGQGADYIEPDVVLTKDGVPICLHDIHLERTTNVEDLHPDRRRADGRWYAADFSLAEIKGLRIDGGIHTAPDKKVAPGIQVATLREMLDLVRLMNEQTGRNVGVIPELKQPAFHRAAGLPMEGRVLSLLKEFGYEKKSDPAIIQCFEAESLKLIRSEHKSELHLSYLTGSLADYLSHGGAAGIARFADSVAPNKGAALMNGAQIIREAKAANLPVIVWTLYEDEAEYRAFMKEHRVFGLFTDYPDLGVKLRG